MKWNRFSIILGMPDLTKQNISSVMIHDFFTLNTQILKHYNILKHESISSDTVLHRNTFLIYSAKKQCV